MSVSAAGDTAKYRSLHPYRASIQNPALFSNHSQPQRLTLIVPEAAARNLILCVVPFKYSTVYTIHKRNLNSLLAVNPKMIHSFNWTAKSLSKTMINTIHLKLGNPHLNPTTLFKTLSTKNGKEDYWNDAWETAWLPDDISPKSRAPWEADVNFLSSEESMHTVILLDVDAETKAFVEDMNENWNERRKSPKQKQKEEAEKERKGEGGGLYSLENIKKDYRLKKQRIHAGLWMKEIDRLEEAKLGNSADDIDRLLDSCSEIFDSANADMENSKVPSSSELKNKPDGWETTSKTPDGNVWEMSQREEDILLQEFDRRIAYCKFQIASFIKTHIFSRRRPIDEWKYMIEEIGPNARKSKGSVSRLPSLSDASTQPLKEEKLQIESGISRSRVR